MLSFPNQSETGFKKINPIKSAANPKNASNQNTVLNKLTAFFDDLSTMGEINLDKLVATPKSVKLTIKNVTLPTKEKAPKISGPKYLDKNQTVIKEKRPAIIFPEKTIPVF